MLPDYPRDEIDALPKLSAFRPFFVRYKPEMAHRKLHLLHPGDGADDRDSTEVLDCLDRLLPVPRARDLVEDNSPDSDIRIERLKTLYDRCRAPGDAPGVDHENNRQIELFCDRSRAPEVGERLSPLKESPNPLHDGDISPPAPV